MWKTAEESSLCKYSDLHCDLISGVFWHDVVRGMQPFILQLYHLSTLPLEQFGIPAVRGRSSHVPCNATLCASNKDSFLSNDT